MRPSRQAGFSLIELAIVLVIIGLLIGGVLTGQALIHASELRAITTEADKNKTAIHAFQDRYLSLPGDTTRAVKFWGALDPVASTCDTLEATGDTATCNGNGDGRIGLDDGLGYEPLRLWQHLANAWLVYGYYTGTTTTAGVYQVEAGRNVPASRYPNGAWCARWRQATTASADHFDEPASNHALLFGADDSVAPCEAPVLSPEDALNIDRKLDDGRPGTGAVQTMWRTACTDATGPTDRHASYLASISEVRCALVLRKAF